MEKFLRSSIECCGCLDFVQQVSELVDRQANHIFLHIKRLVLADLRSNTSSDARARRRGNVLPTEGWTICMRTDINSGIACLSLGRFFFFDSSSTHLWSGSCFFFSNLRLVTFPSFMTFNLRLRRKGYRRTNIFSYRSRFLSSKKWIVNETWILLVEDQWKDGLAFQIRNSLIQD